ncbi:MAG: tetratricopeptide repeat protein [Rhizomicrobium sp.]
MRTGRVTGAVLGIFLSVLLVRADAGPPTVDAAAVALRAGNASNAVVLATQALADPTLTPQDRARVLVDRGLAHEILGARDAALIDLTEAINSRALPSPELARAYYDRGVTLDELGRTEDAAGDYSAAIRIEAKFSAALNNRANAWRRLGKLDAARADYLASIAAGNPRLEYPNFGLGQVAEAAGQPERARGYYRAALAANSQFALATERLTALANAQPPSGTAASPVNRVSAPDTPVVLRPPPGTPSSADGPVVLRPPAIHLRPPVARRASPPAPGLDLKPAFSEGSSKNQTVQLGAWRSETDATDAWNRIIATGGNLLAGLSPQVVPIDLPGKGRFYRLRAGPVSRGVAPGLCEALRAKNLECIVVRD